MKKIIFPNDDEKYSRYRFLFEILYNDKIYVVKDDKNDFINNLKVNDEVEIAVWKNIAIWADDLKKKKEVNYGGVIPALIFVVILLYAIFFAEQMATNYLYILPIIILIILMFIAIYSLNGKKK